MSIPRLDAETALKRAAAVVASAHGVTVSDVLRPRGRPLQHARRLALYLAVTGLGVRRRQLAAAVPCDRRGLARVLHHLEEQRDDPNVDRHISQLEERLAA